jgi:hypothetical protein
VLRMASIMTASSSRILAPSRPRSDPLDRRVGIPGVEGGREIRGRAVKSIQGQRVLGGGGGTTRARKGWGAPGRRSVLSRTPGGRAAVQVVATIGWPACAGERGLVRAPVEAAVGADVGRASDRFEPSRRGDRGLDAHSAAIASVGPSGARPRGFGFPTRRGRALSRGVRKRARGRDAPQSLASTPAVPTSGGARGGSRRKPVRQSFLGKVASRRATAACARSLVARLARASGSDQAVAPYTIVANTGKHAIVAASRAG